MFGHMTTVVWDAQCVQRRMGEIQGECWGSLSPRLSPLNGGGGGGGGGGKSLGQQISLDFKAFKSSRMNDELNQKLLK